MSRPQSVETPAPRGQSVGEIAGKPHISNPRELLARWAREDALGSLDGESLPVRAPKPSAAAALRFDSAHGVPHPPAPFVDRAAPRSALSTPVAQSPASPEPPASVPIIHAPHGLNPPHYPVAPVRTVTKGSSWVTAVGQVFAYFGVGGLTVGTVLALMGYFGGPTSYATTGWLIATAGQMLLFLGVVTLVSGGMEQTTQEVARRIDTLGERLERIEHAALSGPASSATGRAPLE